MLTDIFFIRHGDPLHPFGIEYRVMPGPDLSEKGRREAQQAADFLSNRGVEHLFVSPFARTTQTAEQLVERLDIPVTLTQLIQESHPGESMSQTRERVREFLQSVQQSSFGCIGVVSHGAPIGEMVRELSRDQIDMSQHSYDVSRNPAPTAGIWHAHRTAEDEEWHLAFVFRPGE